MRPRVSAALAFGVLAVSWAAIFIRLVAAHPLTTAALRLSIAAAPLLVWVVIRHRRELMSLQRREWLLLAASGVALALHFSAWVSSLDYTSVASSVTIATTTPVWVALFERPPKTTIVGMAVAMVGSAIIAGTDFAVDSKAMLGNGLALAGAWFAAIYYMVGKRVRLRLGIMQYVGVVYPIAAVCLCLAALIAGAPLKGLTPFQWKYLFFLAVVAQLVGHSLLDWALEHVSAAAVSIAVLGEPVFSTLLAIPLLHEVPSPSSLLGILLVLVGVGVAAWAETKVDPSFAPSSPS